MKRLAIICTHPIQYYVPVFQLLSKNVQLHVFYTWGKGSIQKYDPGFGKVIEWDIPLLENYTYTFEKNTAKDPGSHHFKGIKNPELIQHLKKFSPDALLVFGWAYQSHLKVLRHFKGKVQVWFRGDSTLLDEQTGFKSLFKSYFLRWVYQHVDRAFYVGIENKLYFLKYGLKEFQLSFAPHAIDNERFAEKKPKEIEKLRRSFGINENEILILFAGKFETKKNPLILIEAFAQLNAPNMHLLFVGNGELESSLKLKVKKQKLSQVHFMDFQNQSRMPVIYQSCDLFCLPSSGPGETWGLAVNEAMASGKAVLVSEKVGCAINLVLPENGKIFKANDLDNLILNLNSLNSKSLLFEMGKNSSKIIQHWTFQHICIQILKTLNFE